MCPSQCEPRKTLQHANLRCRLHSSNGTLSRCACCCSCSHASAVGWNMGASSEAAHAASRGCRSGRGCHCATCRRRWVRGCRCASSCFRSCRGHWPALQTHVHVLSGAAGGASTSAGLVLTERVSSADGGIHVEDGIHVVVCRLDASKACAAGASHARTRRVRQYPAVAPGSRHS